MIVLCAIVIVVAVVIGLYFNGQRDDDESPISEDFDDER